MFQTKKEKKGAVVPDFPLSAIRPASGHIFPLSEFEAARSYYEKNGYVVIRDIMSPDELSAARDQLGEDFRQMGTGVSMNKEPENKQMPSIFSVGCVKDKDAGLHQSKTAWLCRAAAAPVFRKLYRQSEADVRGLITSFDGMTFFRPSPKFKTTSPWWHVDSNGEKCTQGLVLLTPTSAGSGGLVVVPRSHLLLSVTLADRASQGKSNTTNFLPITWNTDTMKRLFQTCGGAVMVTAPAGSISLWDSRLIHSNSPKLRALSSDERKAQPFTGFTRLGFYVCMIPRPGFISTSSVKLAKHSQANFQSDSTSPEEKLKSSSSVATLSPSSKKRKAGQISESSEVLIEKTTRIRNEILESGHITNHWPAYPKMQKQRLIYPRAKTSLPLSSCAMPVDEIRREYGQFL